MNIHRIFKLLVLALFNILSYSQGDAEWHHLDPEDDNVLGISTYKAYELLKDKESRVVIVAIIDNGAEIGHEDLKEQLWINEREVAGNGIDDDKNGFVDDIHGWNFLGNEKNENIKRETTELTRIYAQLKNEFNKADFFKDTLSEKVKYFKLIEHEFNLKVSEKKNEIKMYENLLVNYKLADSFLKNYFSNDTFCIDSLEFIKDTAGTAFRVKSFILELDRAGLNQQKIEGIIKNMNKDLETRLNPEFKIRDQIIGDSPSNISDSLYGNNQVDAMGPYHGTGVAGTIGAIWDQKGISGVAKNVKLMILRVLPNGDERDKDVALAIKYAVRNGADVINCSFGKPFSPYKEFVQDAIKEAEKAGVIIVHAAGNKGSNNDSVPVFPSGLYDDGSRAPNWICVGATNKKDSVNMVASFSNYGENSIDIFAPGVEIKSCALGSKYDWASGTSVAAPIVTGMVAVLKSYYPNLAAGKIKELILRSGYKPKTIDVTLPGKRKKKINFKQLSRTGLIANLYNAVLLAEQNNEN